MDHFAFIFRRFILSLTFIWSLKPPDIQKSVCVGVRVHWKRTIAPNEISFSPNLNLIWRYFDVIMATSLRNGTLFIYLYSFLLWRAHLFFSQYECFQISDFHPHLNICNALFAIGPLPKAVKKSLSNHYHSDDHRLRKGNKCQQHVIQLVYMENGRPTHF